MTPPLVAVTWDDAKSVAVEEYDLNEIRTQFHRPARYTTYGLLVVDDPAGVTLGAEQGDDGRLRGLTFIPRAMIVDVRHLSCAATRTRKKRPAAAPQTCSTSA